MKVVYIRINKWLLFSIKTKQGFSLYRIDFSVKSQQAIYTCIRELTSAPITDCWTTVAWKWNYWIITILYGDILLIDTVHLVEGKSKLYPNIIVWVYQ